MEFVSTKNNALYRNIIRAQRNHDGYNWPGKPLNAPAVTLYPNIVAEIEASGMYLWCPAQHAGVSKEIMAAVMEDGEDMTLSELSGLCRLYGCKASYLSAPTLQVVDPATGRGKVRRRVLADLLAAWEDQLDCGDWKVKDVLAALNNGKPVTYAAYRGAVGELRSAAEQYQRKQHRPRSYRMTPVEEVKA